MTIAAMTRLRNRLRTVTAATRNKVTDLRRYETWDFGFAALERRWAAASS